MARVERFRQAEQDLLSIAEYIARDSPIAASKWLDEIEAKLLFAAQNPYAGEAVDHLRKGLRRITHGSYLIFYEPQEFGITLVRVVHGARRLEDLISFHQRRPIKLHQRRRRVLVHHPQHVVDLIRRVEADRHRV